MSANERARHVNDYLIPALAAHEHWRLYRTSPTFKAKIDTLAAMLPEMVNGLAADAEEQDRIAESRRRQLEHAVGPGLLTLEQAREAFPEIFTDTPEPPKRAHVPGSWPGPTDTDSDGFPIPSTDPIDMARQAQGEHL